MAVPRHLFAYGTLMSRLAAPEIAGAMRHLRRVGHGTVRGRLYDVGEYPGAVLARTGNPISGEVFELPPVKRVLSLLDAYEGFTPKRRKTSQFVRERWPVTMSNGDRLDCWVYVYNGPLATARLIPSGRYLARRLRGKTSTSSEISPIPEPRKVRAQAGPARA
jgi:gamma-glutamylcyclotransferase (GGCT)/AIG2-like uncharacterized protein YtfP